MLPGYKQNVLNGIAFQRLDRPIYVPAPSLNVEGAEYTGNYKMLVTHHNKQPAAVLPNPATLPYEKTSTKFQNDTLTNDDFPKSEFFGSAIMGI